MNSSCNVGFWLKEMDQSFDCAMRALSKKDDPNYIKSKRKYLEAKRRLSYEYKLSNRGK